MTKMLSFFANGNVILALKGGYKLSLISESMSGCVSILLGDKCPSIMTNFQKKHFCRFCKLTIRQTIYTKN